MENRKPYCGNLKLLLGFVLVSMVIGACKPNQPSAYQGGLYFAQGSYLMNLSLQDGSLSVVGHLGDTIIREITAFGDNHLLIAESASVNRRRVQRVSWFDLKTGESADLYAGTRARFLPAGNVVVYDDGSDMFAVPQIDGSANRKVFSHSKNQLSWMTVASGGVLLFESGNPSQAVIHSWNSLTNELRQLDALATVCRLQGSVWIESLERLACKERGGPMATATYILADVEGNVDGALDLPADSEYLALGYIENQDALILQETSSSMLGERDQHVIWIHDILTGANHRVPGGLNLGKFVVYADF